MHDSEDWKVTDIHEGPQSERESGFEAVRASIYDSWHFLHFTKYHTKYDIQCLIC